MKKIDKEEIYIKVTESDFKILNYMKENSKNLLDKMNLESAFINDLERKLLKERRRYFKEKMEERRKK
jgi:hypothetical protein